MQHVIATPELLRSLHGHDVAGVFDHAQLRPVASRVLGTPEAAARNLLVHCAQEMNHLAGFLPDLYAAFGDE